MKPGAMMDDPHRKERGGLMAQAFDVRGGLTTWQKDKRNGG
jgi:hypothetical protein